ncbi:ribonuclease HII [Microbispora sp. NPDC049125]|uniref:ribonuclease HII n=1 Tax=Microbispora sp. NPDC049125 TaxID=3154929 RepID=UPI003465D850
MVCAAITDFSPPPELPGRGGGASGSGGEGGSRSDARGSGDGGRGASGGGDGVGGRTGGRSIRLTDSKLLLPAQREAFAEVLPGWLTCHAFGESGPEEIDEVGMTEALRRATLRALGALPVRPDVIILDGGHDFLGKPWRVRCEVKADQRSVTVAAASVLAKVRRDRMMAELGAGYPAYGFGGNAGYPSPGHQEALAELGPTPLHRMSWSYLDDLPQWRHLRRHRDPLAGSGQMSLL